VALQALVDKNESLHDHELCEKLKVAAISCQGELRKVFLTYMRVYQGLQINKAFTAAQRQVIVIQNKRSAC
jgi:hypothetical protein